MRKIMKKLKEKKIKIEIIKVKSSCILSLSLYDRIECNKQLISAFRYSYCVGFKSGITLHLNAMQ